MEKKSLEELMLAYAGNRREDDRARNYAAFIAYRDQIFELHRNG